MNAAQQVKQALAMALKEVEIPAAEAWEKQTVPKIEAPRAVVGVLETESGETALWNYLGTVWDEAAKAPAERFGRRMQMKLYVDFYAPRREAAAIEECCKALEEMAFSPLLEGLRLQSVRREAISYDSGAAALKCRCTVSCTACFTALRKEDSALLTDINLKGLVK